MCLVGRNLQTNNIWLFKAFNIISRNHNRPDYAAGHLTIAIGSTTLHCVPSQHLPSPCKPPLAIFQHSASAARHSCVVVVVVDVLVVDVVVVAAHIPSTQLFPLAQYPTYPYQ